MPKVSFDFSNKAYEDLEILTKELDVSSKAETIRRILGLAKLIVKEKKNGHRIIIESNDGTKELVGI